MLLNAYYVITIFSLIFSFVFVSVINHITIIDGTEELQYEMTFRDYLITGIVSFIPIINIIFLGLILLIFIALIIFPEIWKFR